MEHPLTAAPSAWLLRWAHLLRPQGTVLDVACGHGRHVRWLAARGQAVTAVDRDAAALAPLATCAQILVADLETAPWPLLGKTFDAVLVTNYLWRDLLPSLITSLAPGGILIYETFAMGNERLGKPSNPNFLLRPGELLQAFRALQIVAYEDGTEPIAGTTGMRCVQRIVATAAFAPAAAPAPAPLGHQSTQGAAAKLAGLPPLLHAPSA